MRRMPIRLQIPFLCVVVGMWVASAVCAADVETTVDVAALSEIETVVVLPFGCGTDDDCRKLEDDVARAVREVLGLEVIPRERVEKAVDLIGLQNPQGHLAHLVAEEVDADAYLRVQSRETAHENPNTGSIAGPGGLTHLRWDPRSPGAIGFQKRLLAKIKSAGLELVATDGTELIQGRSKGRRGLVDHVEGIFKHAARQQRRSAAP